MKHSHYIPRQLLHSHHHQPFSFPLLHPTSSLSRRPRGIRMDSDLHHHHHPWRRQKDKIIVIMGATGCGKSKLSIDLATRFHAEIINSDKMQVYKGLDITTNKIPVNERCGIAHHLLGKYDPAAGEFTPSGYRLEGGVAISNVVSREKLPIVVGGSNSFNHALVVDRYDPELDIFDRSGLYLDQTGLTGLRYECCFLWVDVSFPVLYEYLHKRVDEMLDSGMFEELIRFFDSVDPTSLPGLGKAIGVPELWPFYKKFLAESGGPGGLKRGWDQVQTRAYEDAVKRIKEHTCQLAIRQNGKIMRLKEREGWDLKRVDATEAFCELMKSKEDYLSDDDGENVSSLNYTSSNNLKTTSLVGMTSRRRKKVRKKRRWMDLWEKEVVDVSAKIVKRFLEN